MKLIKTIAGFLLLTLAVSAQAGELAISSWLVAGPVQNAMAVDEAVSNGEADQFATLDAYHLWPEKGTTLRINPAVVSKFTVGKLELKEAGAMLAGAVYLEVPAWQRGSFTVKGAPAFRLWYEGEQILERTNIGEADAELTAETNLVRGKRRLLILASGEGGLEVSWTPKGEAELPTTSFNPRHTFDISDYSLQESAGSLDLSPDGELIAFKVNHWDPKTITLRSRLMVVDAKKKSPLFSIPEAQTVSEFAWSDDSQRLLIAVPGVVDGTTDLIVWSRRNGLTSSCVSGLKDASGFTWAPDGSGVYYTASIAAKESDAPYKVEWGLLDRTGGWRDRQQIRFVDPSGTNVLVWEGLYAADGFQLTADGKALFLMRTLPRKERPYEIMELVRVDLTSGEAKSLYTSPLQRDGTTVFGVSPDGGKVAFVAGRYEVTGNDNANPNITDADGDLWILDLATGEATNVARDFEPAVGFFYYGSGRSGDLIWHPDGQIVFNCLMDRKVLVGTYDPSKGTFTTQEMPTPGFNNLDIAEAKGVRSVAFEGTELEGRLGVYLADRRNGRGGEVFKLNDQFNHLIDTSPKVVDYDYVNSEGVNIRGILYYPANYDPSGSYPMIIDYYGGVIGYGYGWDWNSRAYQSQGYFVYTPISRGAAGYGAEYANTHPNDWGELSGRDIAQGVRHIVANVPGVDGNRVAPTSGSYGGYLNVYLLAMDKESPDYYPFATSATHAGIYDMMDYWGKGDWGFLYMDMAAAGSWPWNATEKYIEWSPVFRADNITVPILITHGDDDNNVPPENSWMLYTALEVLNRENVWFVHYPGQRHGLVQGDRKGYLDSRRMRIEWFDKILRNQPGAFDWRMRDEKKK